MSLKRLQKIQFNINDKIGQIEKLVGKEGDNLTRGLEVQLLNNNIVVDDISTIDCMLIAKQKGAGVEDTFVVPSIKVNNKFEIIYPSNLMKKGIVEGEIRFTQGEQILTSFIFEIDMARTLVVEEITDSIYEQRLIDVIVDVVANEEERIANEEERQSNESTRLSNESERKSNEVERISQESIRQSNEDARIDEENTRQTNESTRQTNESIRESNEIARQSNEDTRKSNEEDRVAFYEMLQQMLANGELNGEVTLEELNELAGEGRTTETVKGNADDIQDITKTLNSHLAESASWIRVDTLSAPLEITNATYDNSARIPLNVICNATRIFAVDFRIGGTNKERSQFAFIRGNSTGAGFGILAGTGDPEIYTLRQVAGSSMEMRLYRTANSTGSNSLFVGAVYLIKDGV